MNVKHFKVWKKAFFLLVLYAFIHKIAQTLLLAGKDVFLSYYTVFERKKEHLNKIVKYFLCWEPEYGWNL